jgi:hypothetical protein
MQFDREKFKRLVHYVIWKAGKRDWFGAVKLNKVLWFADARAYSLTGKSITGETYIREKWGPVPKHMMPVRSELESEAAISITKEGRLTRFVALLPPDTSLFSVDEMNSVDYWIDHIDRDHTAGTISEKTHDEAWEMAELGEELPLYAYRVVRIKEPDEDDLRRLKERAEELGLN